MRIANRTGFVFFVLERRTDKVREEGMWLERPGFELWMELAAQKPRMVRSFDDLDVILVRSAAGDAQARGGKYPFVIAIELVAVAMALADFELAVGFGGERAGLEFAGPRTQAHGATHFIDAEQFAEFVDDAMRGLRVA